MKLSTHPPDIHQFVGILLGVFGVLLGLISYLGGIYVLETQFGGGILPDERRFLAVVSSFIVLLFVAIAYSFAKE